MEDRRRGVVEGKFNENESSKIECTNSGDGDHSSDDVDFVMDAIIKCQSSRINDQRTVLPERKEPNDSEMDEEFFQFLSKMQGDRFDEQRASLETTTTTTLQKQDNSIELKKDKQKSNSSN